MLVGLLVNTSYNKYTSRPLRPIRASRSTANLLHLLLALLLLLLKLRPTPSAPVGNRVLLLDSPAGRGELRLLRIGFSAECGDRI